MEFFFCIFAASSEIYHARRCENIELYLNDCTNGKVIHVISASYGKHRPATIDCDHDTDRPIGQVCSSGITREVSQHCDGNATCTIPVNDRSFGDPCAAPVQICVTVEYVCGAQTGIQVQFNKTHSTKLLSC